MIRKTKVLYKAVFENIKSLVPNFIPENVMADYENASVQALNEVFDNGFVIKGRWFHFSNSVIKHVRAIGLTIGFHNDAIVRKCVRALTCLPLLAHDKIVETFNLLFQFTNGIPAASPYKDKIAISTMFQYITRRWIECSSVSPERLSVFGCTERTNNNAESFHSRFKRRVKVAHPNIFNFLRHLSNITTDLMTDVVRLEQHRPIEWRTPLKQRLLVLFTHILMFRRYAFY